MNLEGHSLPQPVKSALPKGVCRMLCPSQKSRVSDFTPLCMVVAPQVPAKDTCLRFLLSNLLPPDTKLIGSSCLGASGLCSSRQFDPEAAFNQRAMMWWLSQPTPLKFHLILLSWGRSPECLSLLSGHHLTRRAAHQVLGSPESYRAIKRSADDLAFECSLLSLYPVAQTH